MSGNKTQANKGEVAAFLDGIVNNRRAADTRVIVDLMQRITGCAPVMWGDSVAVMRAKYHG